MNAENFYVVQDTNVVADAQSMFEVEFDRLEDAAADAEHAQYDD